MLAQYLDINQEEGLKLAKVKSCKTAAQERRQWVESCGRGNGVQRNRNYKGGTGRQREVLADKDIILVRILR